VPTIKITIKPHLLSGDLRREVSAPGFRIELIRLVGEREVRFRHQGEAFIGLTNVVKTEGETHLDGKRSTLKDIRGRLTFVPPDVLITGWAKYPSRRSSYLNVYFDPLSGDFGAYDIASVEAGLHFQDAALTATMLKYKDALVEQDCDDVTYLETIGLLLLQELCKWRPSGSEPHSAGGLTPVQLARIRDYISGHINAAITIVDLAALVGMSRFHLIRAFRETVGVTPYQYVLMERVKVAKELLRNQTTKVDDVARAVGFNDPLQLTRAFRKFTNLTPTEFRAQRGD
jgi:AraC family transcriptional regulator